MKAKNTYHIPLSDRTKEEDEVLDKNGVPLKKGDKFTFTDLQNRKIYTDFVKVAIGNYVEGVSGTGYHRDFVEVVE